MITGTGTLQHVAGTRRDRAFQLPGFASRLLSAPLLAGLLLWCAGCDVDTAVASGELTYKVTRGDLVVSFTERGNVMAAKSEQVYCMVEGRSTIVRIVPEGTFVKKGDVIIELDSSELTQTINQQEISTQTSEATLQQAEEETKIQTSLSNSEVRQAEVDLELAELQLQKFLEGDFPLSKTMAEGDVTLQQETLQRARTEYEWSQKLAGKGYISGTELVAERLKVREAELREKEKIHSLKVLEDWTYQKDLKTYSFAVEQARDALDRAKRKRDAEISKVEADERGKRRTHELNVARLSKLKGELDKTIIRAPADGMVVYYAERYRRERLVEQGAEVRENQLLMTLPDVSTMAVELAVHESWVDQVRIGLPTLISIDAMPELNIKGKVSKVGLLPDSVNRWMNPDLKVYKTNVTVDDSESVELLKPGMSAKVQVIITVRKDVLFVPVQSVTTVDGKQVCFVLAGSGFQPRPVETGKFNESLIEIVSGLEDGVIIQLNAPPPSGSGDEKVTADMQDLASKAEAVWADDDDAATRGASPRGGGRRDGGERMSRGGGEGDGPGFGRGEEGAGGGRGGGRRMSRGGGEGDGSGVGRDEGGFGEGRSGGRRMSRDRGEEDGAGFGRGEGERGRGGPGGEGGGVDRERMQRIMQAMREGTPVSAEDLEAVPARFRERLKARSEQGEGAASGPGPGPGSPAQEGVSGTGSGGAEGGAGS